MSAILDQVRVRRRLPSPALARAIRLAADVTQQAVADELGVHRVTVARWELGTRRPGRKLLRAYVELLDQLREAAGD